MDLLPSTVTDGDQITLRITRTTEGNFVPSNGDCRLFISGITDEFDDALETNDWVKTDLTVTSCKWAAGDGADMLFVSLNGFEPAETPENAASTEPESAATGAISGSSTESGISDGESSDSSNAERSSQSVGSSASHTGASDRKTSNDKEVDAASKSAAPGADDEAVPPASVDEAAAVSDVEHREVDWDGDAPLDTDLLQRIVNGGHRVPTAEEHVELDHSERTAIEISTVLVDLANDLAVSAAVCYRAGELYADAMQHDLIRGKSKFVTAAASFRLATLIEEEHRALAVIAGASDGNVSTNEIADKERQMVSELDLEPKLMIIPPQKFIPYLVHSLGIEPDASIVSDAMDMASKASGSSGGPNPLSTAAAAIYAAGLQQDNEKFTQQQIADVANTSEVTIRNNYKELLGS